MKHLSKLLMRMAAMALLLLLLAPAARGQSALDGFDPNVNGTVDVAVVQPDGKILIGGSFTSVLGVTRNNIARLNPDGTLDSAFDPNANSVVNSIAVQADGKILAGGGFTTIGGQPGSMPPPDRLMRLTRTRTMLSIPSLCSRTARF
jgi:hypothetical protein